jgi:hypothetical protein
MTRNQPGREVFEPVEPITRLGTWPGSLLDRIDEVGGGIWQTGDHEAEPATIVRRVHDVGTSALALDARDLTFLADLPQLRFLRLATDGIPILDPLARLLDLEGLLLEVGGARGTFDPLALSHLRWLRVSLGGKLGTVVAKRLLAGHDQLEWLGLTEVPYRSADDLVAHLPRLRHLRLHFADHLRSLGDLGPVAPSLRGIELDITGIRTIAGLEVARKLELFALSGPRVDLGPLAELDGLRYAAFVSVGIDLEPLRGHRGLRMIFLRDLGPAERAILETMPRLVAVGASGTSIATPWADLTDKGEPLREEWFRRRSG